MKSKIKYFLIIICAFLFIRAAVTPVTMFTIGDSTVADYDASTSLLRGWGQMIRSLIVSSDVSLVNAARNGRSSKSFYTEGLWSAVKAQLKAGDYVFIQFGHNDEKDGGISGTGGIGTAPWGEYTTYLTKYVQETRSMGAIPVLVTPIVRRYFSGTTITRKGCHDLSTTTDDSTLNYPRAMKAVARKYNVLLIDLTSLTKKSVENYGETYTTNTLYASGDGTHTTATGATVFANLVKQEMLRQSILLQAFQTAATLTKHGSGSSSQTITLSTAITSFYYTWANATSVSVSGLPSGVNSVLNATAKTVTISGIPTVSGIYTYTISTTGGSPNASVSGTITVNNSSSSTLIYQGENAVINTGVTETKNAGYTGTGYANADNAIGKYVEWTVTTSTAGSFSIFFRYASVGDRPADIYVNGTKIISALAFPTTVAWTTWSTTAVKSVTLLNGVNKIRATATTTGGPANLDYLQVTGSGTLKSASANSIKVSAPSQDEITIYPNPVKNIINISGNLKESGAVTVCIYNQLGHLIDSRYPGVIEKGNFNVSVPADKVKPGIYVLKVQMNGEVKTHSFVKK